MDTEAPICKSCGQVIVIPAEARSHIGIRELRYGVDAEMELRYSDGAERVKHKEVVRRQIPVLSIRYFEADHKLTKVVYNDGDVCIDETLKSLEKEFGGLFMRIHRGILVATAYIEAFRVNRIANSSTIYMFVQLEGDIWLPTSRKYRPRVRAFFRDKEPS